MALIKIGVIAAITDAVAASLVSGATQTRDAVDARIDVRAGEAIAEAISDNPQLVTNVIAAINADPALLGGLAWSKGALANTDLNEIVTDGIYTQGYSTGATLARNYPVTTSGVLTVVTAANGNVTQVYDADADRGIWRRVRSSGVWSLWERVTSTIKNRGLAAETPLSSLVNEGTWYQRYAGNTPGRDYPYDRPAQVEVRVLDASIGARSQEVIPDDVTVRPFRRTAMGNVWSPWMTDTGNAHQIRRDRARMRKGGRIGTAGRGAIALRFDDYHDVMGSYIMPLLRQYKLPAYHAITPRIVEEESTVSWATIRGWADDGIEFFNHSWTHQEPDSSQLVNEIVRSADRLETSMPGVAIDGWVMPGTGAGTSAYGGFGAGGSLEAWKDTAAGQLILSRHGVAHGSIQGHLAPLTGDPVIGQVHWTYEDKTLAETKAQIEYAQRTGTGLNLMAHPWRFGETGYMSKADFEALLAWIAAERDAERLVVLTGTGLAFADSSTSERFNVLPSMDSLAGWGGTTGWTASGGIFSGTKSAGRVTASLPGEAVNHLRGGIMECVALVKAPTGAVVRTAITGGVTKTTDHTLPASNDWQWVRTHALYPTTAGVAAGLGAAIGRVSGGAVSLAALSLRPV